MEEIKEGETLLAQHKIPIIDIAYITQELVCPVKACTRQAAQKLHRALIETGYAFLVNHGITEQKMQAAYCKFDTFCSLPDEKKGKYSSGDDNSRNNHYKLPGSKVVGRLHEFKHDYHIVNVDVDALPDDEVPGFTHSVSTVVRELQSLAAVILQFIAIGCRVEPKYFLQYHKNLLEMEDDCYFQMVYYPAIDDCKPINELTSAENNDTGTFTIMAQDSEIGLQVRQSNRWEQVGYLPGALLLRAGLCLQKWTDSCYKPTSFRMTVPTDSSILARSRHSALLHVHPQKSVEIEPLMVTAYECQTYYPIETKSFCSLRRVYHYIQRKIRRWCW